MGLLYNVLQVKEQQNVMDELQARGIRFAKDGRPLDQLSYKELVMQLALAKVADIDIENQDHKWF